MEQHKQGPYHHGQLRQALLDAAVQIISEQGIDHLTLREVARKAGVSHAAPYHHFTDKSALIEAIVLDGFHTLAAIVRETVNNVPGDAVDKIAALGKAYVRFALEHSATFRLMYRPELYHASPARSDGFVASSAIDEASEESFQMLVDTIVAGQQEGLIRSGNVMMDALTMWCSIHGAVVLWLDGSLSSLTLEEKNIDGVNQLDQLAEQVASTLMEGLRKR